MKTRASAEARVNEDDKTTLRKSRNCESAERFKIKKEAYAEILRETNTSDNHAKVLAN